MRSCRRGPSTQAWSRRKSSSGKSNDESNGESNDESRWRHHLHSDSPQHALPGDCDHPVMELEREPAEHRPDDLRRTGR